MLDFFISIWSESYQAPHCQKLLCPSCTCELKGLFNKSTPCNYPDVRFSLFLCNFKTNPLKRDFPWSGGPERYPDWNSDIKLKVRKYSDFGFRNISLKLISSISFINIGKPTFPGSGTLPQTMTIESFFFWALTIWKVFPRIQTFSVMKEACLVFRAAEVLVTKMKNIIYPLNYASSVGHIAAQWYNLIWTKTG